ncbi:MAG TPA: antibiotic biosynthesis monooxygenase [Rheinheimera sp.]|uniref:putative quinol monooxygenase n=1 Tax=Rheinheimera sp. TaxID=1869214 RepID=UPI000ECE4874|nr:putative quinol monooxygenase [Rheinheimera sp.]HCU64461.1 antibiotic biosynthesis monooxygenase [Rheinheimera sp.]
MNNSIVIVRYRALPAQVDTVRREIAALVATVRASEPDCGGITMLQDSSDPTAFTLIETWPSQEVFLGPHMQQPHIQSFIQAAGKFLAGPPDISFWQPVDGA